MRNLAVAAALLLAAPAFAEGVQITAATLAEPTARYDHAVLGDALEWGALRLTLSDGSQRLFRLPETRVFEDVTTRLVDADGDGRIEVMVVESDVEQGAALTLWGPDGRIARTDFIGQRHRWLAPVAVADLDGDGQPEIAYIDRPHLQRDLVLLHFDGAAFTELARLPGLTNHRINDTDIAGGLRACSDPPALILADADWTQAIAVTYAAGQLTATPQGAIRGPADLTRATRC
jgi:hypothetical protein